MEVDVGAAAAKAGDEPASNASEDGRKEEEGDEEKEKAMKTEEGGGDKEEQEQEQEGEGEGEEEGAEQDDSSNHLPNDETSAGVKKEAEEGEEEERPKGKGQRGKKPRVREWEKLVLHNDFCVRASCRVVRVASCGRVVRCVRC